MKSPTRERSFEQLNQELIALQKISGAMISTSFLDDVLTIIVEGLEEGLHFDAGILFILDRQKQMLYPHITHRNPFVTALEKELNISFGSLTIPVVVNKNELAEAVRERKIITTEKVTNLLEGSSLKLSPDLEKKLSQATMVKNFVIVPMIIRNEVAGLILCATSLVQLTTPEIESLRNFSNQAGLALDNAQIMNSLKSTQAELSRQNDRLNKALGDLKELEALKEGLVGMVVHDLKNPLTSIRGYLELILEATTSQERQADVRSYVKSAFEGSEDLLKMIHNLLDISRMEEGKFRLHRSPQKIQDIIQSVYEQLNVVAEHNHRHLKIIPNDKIPPFNVDYEILQRVLANLVSNAIRHTNKSGTIKVSASQDHESFITICVEDDGEGIAMEAIDSIFEKFTQVGDKSHKNTHNVGLGLTFCKMAVETHGGKIWVESVVNKGSKFYFSIPFEE